MPVAPFDAVEAALLRGWTGGRDHPELPVLFAGLDAHARPSRIDTVRPGYDDVFLGTKIDLPDIPGTGDEFPYLHFSVIMNPARRLAWYVAYNVRERSQEASGRQVAAGSDAPTRLSAGRRALPPERVRPRPSGEPGDGGVGGAAARADRDGPGVLLDEHLAAVAGLQPEVMAASRGARARDRGSPRGAIGFSGPVFAADDREYRGSAEMRGRLRAHRTFLVPRRYFKLVAALGADGRLEAAAHCVENSTEPVTPVVVGLEELEALTGLLFPPALHEAGPLDE